MDAQLKEAISLAAEISKQLITLSTGMILISITFASSFARKVAGRNRRLLLISWLAFLSTIIIALWHLSALTGNLLQRPIDMRIRSATGPALLQLLTFVFGVVAFVMCAWRSESSTTLITPPADDVLP